MKLCSVWLSTWTHTHSAQPPLHVKMYSQTPSCRFLSHSSTLQCDVSKDTSTSEGMLSTMPVSDCRGIEPERVLGPKSCSEGVLPRLPEKLENLGAAPPCIQLSWIMSSSLMSLVIRGWLFLVERAAIPASLPITSSSSWNSLPSVFSSPSSTGSPSSSWMPAANLKICLQCPLTTLSMRSRGTRTTTLMLLLISRPKTNMTATTSTMDAMFAADSSAATTDMS
mmetsp:Transcript_122542/g.329204  ORF Transcript_122542/g.329204 Transcript_122542/m.329204 type:complete len:224 (-) Transcript_122542:31-702(-)